MKKKIITALVILGVICVIGYKLAGNVEIAGNKAYMPDLNKSVIVNTQTIEKGGFNIQFNYSGSFAPNREIMLIPQAQGEVKGVYFTEGQNVSAGKVLVRIDDALLQSQLIAAKAAYDNAKTNYERFHNASASDGVTKMQVDGNYLQMKSAESQLRQLQITIDKCQLTAPFAGTITMRDVEVGSVNSMTPVGRLTDVSSLKLELNIPESDIVYFNTGHKVEITTDIYPGEIYKGSVEYVSDRGDDAHNYQVKIRVPNHSGKKLKAGMYGNVVLHRNLSTKALTIPRTALLGSARKPQVYVVANGRAMLRNVVTGRSNGTLIEVLDGIKKGEKVVTGGQINLTDSCKVELAK
ncbi:MAG: efflux RND transporter periplasmic adaptor subunit [Bacteroidales bacterium]|nr:efflux RND transporter periplasmic adaptor subunit [Bacteroidales bacterium]